MFALWFTETFEYWSIKRNFKVFINRKKMLLDLLNLPSVLKTLIYVIVVPEGDYIGPEMNNALGLTPLGLLSLSFRGLIITFRPYSAVY
jgi:hypothetical protein